MSTNGFMDDKKDKQVGLIEFPEWSLHFDHCPQMCRAPSDDIVLPVTYLERVGKLKSFQARVDDVWVVTFPKSGTTWMQQIVTLIIDGLQPPKLNDQRFPFFEADLFYSTSIRNWEEVLNVLDESQSPRLIKSHLPIQALPDDVHRKKCKIIYVARNPKDVAVSMFHFERMLAKRPYKGDLSSFIKYFTEDKVIYAPFWKHVFDAWAHREDENILFLFYENLQKDLMSEIKKICSFLDRPLTDDEVKVIYEHCTFSAMKTDPSINKEYWKEEGRWKKNGTDFMRKGKVGDWVNFFTPEDTSLMDKWIHDNNSEELIKFEYSL